MTTDTRSRAEVEIRARIERWVEAIGRKDLDAVMALYDPDVVAFDLVPPLVHEGATAYRRVWEECITQPFARVAYELRDVRISASGDVAFCHALSKFQGTRPSGETDAMWLRVTLGMRRVDGEWLVTHEHSSVPFAMDTQRAMLDLEP